MPRVTLHPNGATASCVRSGPLEIEPPKRGKVQGWSVQSTRRLRRWFYSVDGEALTGIGFGLTLTVLELPPSAAAWKQTRERFKKRMVRAGAIRMQWLTEWQRRGVPHLHGCVYFEEGSGVTREDVIRHWLEAAAEWKPGERGQHVTGIWGLPGWLQYQAKHSVRGVRHYQRSNVPREWREGTGRLWGAVGDWPTREEIIEVAMPEYHRFRRLLRGWLVASARRDLEHSRTAAARSTHRRRLTFLRKLLLDPDPVRSRVRAVSDFVPEHVSSRMLRAAQLRDDQGSWVDTSSGEILTGWAVLEAAARGAHLSPVAG